MTMSFFHYLKAILYWEPKFVLHYYLHKGKDNIGADYIFMADGKMIHGGLFDRLKGIISIYALAKVYHKKFGIHFINPFRLEDYLEPNQYDWRVKEDITYSYPHSKPVVAYSERRNPRRLLKKRTAQIHYYFGGDILEKINSQFKTSFNWAEMYHELFKPSVTLRNRLDAVKQNIGKDYIAIHFRFLNLLGEKIEKPNCLVLRGEDKKKLLDSCLSKINEVISIQPESMKVVVFSDSMVFLNYIRERLPRVYVEPGQVKHIDTMPITNEEEVLKLFVDMYLMIGASEVISVVGMGLYSSAFPEYAAKIGNAEFERIKLS